jgi:hypothetical protein
MCGSSCKTTFSNELWTSILPGYLEDDIHTTTLLIIIIIVLLVGGGGWYGRGRWF